MSYLIVICAFVVIAGVCEAGHWWLSKRDRSAYRLAVAERLRASSAECDDWMDEGNRRVG